MVEADPRDGEVHQDVPGITTQAMASGGSGCWEAVHMAVVQVLALLSALCDPYPHGAAPPRVVRKRQKDKQGAAL